MSTRPSRQGERGHTQNGNKSQKGGRKQMVPRELRELKMRTKCTSRGNQGYWAVDHMNNGTIKDGIPSIQPHPKQNHGAIQNVNRQLNGNITHKRNKNHERSNEHHKNQIILNFTCTI